MPFLLADGNVSRQNAAQWVNLQQLPARSCTDHQSVTPLPTLHPSSFLCLTPVPLVQELLLTCTVSQSAAAASGAVVTGEDSVSHTLCIMFASFG